MNKKFTITAVVPNYNYSEYLVERLDSILNQTCGDISIIILDDCSTDNSREIIERYRNNSKVKTIIYNESNSGSPFKQWNKGINFADSDLVWIAESDDSCDVEMIGKLLEAFVEDEDCVMSFCRSRLMDSSGNKKGYHIFQSEADERLTLEGSEFIKKHMVKDNLVVNASSVLFKRSAFENISKEYLNFRYIGDVMFWCEIAKAGTVHYIPDDLNYHRRHDMSQTAVGKTSENKSKSIHEGHMLLDYFLSQNYISKWKHTKMVVGVISYGKRESEKARELIQKEYPQRVYHLLTALKEIKERALLLKSIKTN